MTMNRGCRCRVRVRRAYVSDFSPRARLPSSMSTPSAREALTTADDGVCSTGPMNALQARKNVTKVVCHGAREERSRRGDARSGDDQREHVCLVGRVGSVLSIAPLSA